MFKKIKFNKMQSINKMVHFKTTDKSGNSSQEKGERGLRFLLVIRKKMLTCS